MIAITIALFFYIIIIFFCVFVFNFIFVNKFFDFICAKKNNLLLAKKEFFLTRTKYENKIENLKKKIISLRNQKNDFFFQITSNEVSKKGNNYSNKILFFDLNKDLFFQKGFNSFKFLLKNSFFNRERK